MALPDYISNALGAPGWMEWSNNILIIGLIALFGAVLVHLVAYFFGLEKLKNKVKGEYINILVTFLLVFISIKLIQIGWVMMQEITKQIYLSHPFFYNTSFSGIDPSSFQYDPFVFNQKLIRDTWIECQKTISVLLYMINGIFRVIGSLGVESIGSEGLGGWYTTLYTGIMEYLIQKLSYGIFFNWILITFLSVIKYVAPLLIELGLIFRIIPYTRGFGALLLSMGIGFFAVFPISLTVLITFQPPEVACSDFVPPAMLEESYNELGQSYDPAVLMQTVYVAKSYQKGLDKLLSEIETLVTMLYYQGFIFPLVSLTITFTFIRQTSNILGSDLNEIGQGLIKLI
jgi:hypothetical protein